MAFHVFSKLAIAAAGAAVLTMGALPAPASAAVFNFSFTTVTGGSGVFNYKPAGGVGFPGGVISWGDVTRFRYTPLASAVANGTASITHSIFNGRGNGFWQNYGTRWGSVRDMSASFPQWSYPPQDVARWSVRLLIPRDGSEDKGRISFTQPLSSGGAEEWEAIASWNWAEGEAIPEPTTIAGSLLALGGLAAARRNRQMKTKSKLAA